MKSKQIITALGLIMAIIFIGTGCTQVGREAAIVSTTENVISDYQTFFEEGVVHTIDIAISNDDWTDILANPEDEMYHEATLTVDGVTAEKVGLRTKGNSSLKSVASSESDRFSFKIKFDEYVEDQALLGLDECVLNNMFSDASYMREYLSYKIMGEAGLDVPLSSFVEVNVNGELYGVYLMVEAIEDSYLNRAFGENEGNLYKQEQGSTLIYEADETYKSAEQKNGDDESKTDLVGFIKVLNEMPDGEKGDIESVLNVDSALKYIAANTVLENYDSYNGSFAQNYYLYNESGRFTVIPWDFNMAFGGFQGGILSTIDIDTPISGTTLDKVPLIQNLLEVDDYKARYYEIVKDYMAILEDFESEVSDLATLIRPYVESDPTKFATIEQFDLVTTYQENGPDEAHTEGGFMGKGTMPDANTSATQNTSEDSPIIAGPDGERPAFGDRPLGDMPTGDGPTGERPMGDAIKEGGMRGGMSLTGSTSSLINIMRARLANLKLQLTE